MQTYNVSGKGIGVYHHCSKQSILRCVALLACSIKILLWHQRDSSTRTNLCDVRMMVLPASRTSTSVFHSCRRATGSIPVVGSSRKTIGGLPTNAMAVLSFRLLPPLKQSRHWDLHLHVGLLFGFIAVLSQFSIIRGVCTDAEEFIEVWNYNFQR